MCLLLLSDFKKNLNLSINFSKPAQLIEFYENLFSVSQVVTYRQMGRETDMQSL
jgi:hypothetical protein